jgi:poly(3-hydroxybutyrate) depolymerase
VQVGPDEAENSNGNTEPMKTLDITLSHTMTTRTIQRGLSLLLLLTVASGTGLGQPTIQFAVSTCTVPELDGAISLSVQRTNDSTQTESVDYATGDGSAAAGVNYTATNGTLTFAPGETNQHIFVPILNDGQVGKTTRFQVSLSNPTGGAVLGARTVANVNIQESDKGLHFYVPTFAVNEEAGTVEIKVARGDDGENQVSVDYATADGTATAGQDYSATSGTMTFEPGVVLKSFAVPVLNDALLESAESFRVTLSNPSGDGVLGSPSVTTISIQDTDRRFQFDSQNYAAREEAEYVQVGIIQADNDAPASVDFSTSDGAALAGLDYVGSTNTIQFGPGERRKWIQIPLLNDGLKEAVKSFRITLSNPTGGTALGSQPTATVKITDNDPGVGVTTNTFFASGIAGVAKVSVTRGSDELMSSFTVDFQTADALAQAGVDYLAIAGTLEFKANETLQVITIPLLQNPAAKGRKSFKVTLSNASVGISLGIATTTVNLCNPGGYYPILPPIGAQPKLQNEAGVMLLTWEGDGALQRADQVTGPWEDLPNAASPCALKPNLRMGFYRIQSTRPTEVYVPASWDGETPLPLILFLHPLGGDAAGMRSRFPLEPLAESKGFLVCYPNGTVDANGWRFWNGPDFLSFSNPDMDDAGYLRGVIEEIQRRFPVDPQRIYAAGASSGGAMSHRLAIEHADLIAGIASISGRTYYDPNGVYPTQPVHVLQIDGSGDAYLGWTGPDYGLPYVGEAPGAVRTVQNWARLNGCLDPVLDATPSLDLNTGVTGIDTTVLRYAQCPPGGAVELWTVNGGGHVPTDSPESRVRLVDWLLAHPKPR